MFIRLREFACLMLAAAAMGMPARTVSAQVDPAPPQEKGPAPKIVVESDHIDFGRMTDVEKHTRKVVFRNDGDADLEILGLQGSCGCTVPSLEDLERTIFKPGESGTIEVTFLPDKKHGPQHTNVSITTNDPARPVSNVRVTAIVDPIVLVEPGSVLFPNMPKGRQQSVLLTVRGLKPGFEVTRIIPNAGEHVSASVLFAEDVTDGEVSYREVTIEVAFDGKQMPGRIMGNVTIETNDERRASIPIGVAGFVLGDVQPDVSRWPIGNRLEPGEIVTQFVHLTHRSGQPFKIVDVAEQYSNAEVPVQWEIIDTTDASPGTVTLKLTATANSRPGAMRGQITITTDVPDDPPITIAYWGGVRPVTPPTTQGNGR